MFYLPFITSKTERFSFESGYVEWVVKHLKGDWFIVLRRQLCTAVKKVLLLTY